MQTTGLRYLAILAGTLLITACGGGGGGSGSPPPVTSPPPLPDPGFVALQSDPGDYIGAGLDYRYTQANAEIVVTANGRLLAIRIDGDEYWNGEFELPDTYTRLEVGVYNNLTRYPFNDDAFGGLSWAGEHRGCNELTGSFEILSVTYDGNALTEIELTFEQYCESDSPALRGHIYWYADDTTAPSGPQTTLPPGLWQPAAGTTPGTGNYVYLESDAGDYIGNGNNYLYTPADAVVTVSASNRSLSVGINGNERWNANFEGMSSLSRLEVGYYGDLRRYPFHNPIKGGLSWSGEGRGCNELTGWFVIDSITYNGSTLEAIDLRFEQHCEGGGPALHGKIHWDVNNSTTAPGPTPPPAGLWEPPAGVLPDTSNYVYLESDVGDYVGAGSNYLYTPLDAFITATSSSSLLSVQVDGDEYWNGDFKGMQHLNRLEVGYYGDLQRYPFHNPVKGGLSWSGQGRGCNTLAGWFVIDSITYDGSTVVAVELRFAQHCEGNAAALYGAVRWDANDTTEPPGPVNPPPTGLWEPTPGITPDTGSYVYLESQPGDYVGQGGNYLYTRADAVLSVDVATNDALLFVSVNGDEIWDGNFQGMSSISRLEVGYYGDLQRYPFQNPVKGGLSWSGEGRGCNTLTGWFVVDSVTYDGNDLAAIELRFEQRCDGGPPLHGEIHWDVNDTTEPPGPVVPIPSGLWEPAAGITPESGNYVYLESRAGDWVGQGGNYLYTPQDAVLGVDTTGGRLDVNVRGDESWSGNFQAMNSLNYLQVGYYGDLQRYPFHNPVKGGLSWSGEGRGCNTLEGWFVVDSVTYSGVTLTAIDLRFEQRCDGGPPLYGEIHWDASDTSSPPGPVNPPPTGLWAPGAGATPATGNYIYLDSEPGDYIGQGQDYLYTDAADFTIGSSGTQLNVSVNSDSEWWIGDFEAMNVISRFEVGYYGDLSRVPFHNPVKGGLSWYGESRGCSTLEGWFVVDSVTYDGNTLTAIDLRFEQRCEGGTPALHGAIRWSR